jgi:hypothetical protein
MLGSVDVSVMSTINLQRSSNSRTFQVGVLIEEPFPMLALDALCKQLHDGIKDMMVVQNSVHTRLVAQNKSHGGRNRCAENGWPSSKREDAKID